MNKWGIAERLFHLIATVFGKKVLCIHPIFTACLVLKTTRVLCFKNSPYPARWHAPRKSSRSQNLVPYFYFAFPISKEKAVVNSNFPAGRRKGDFLYVWKNGAPPVTWAKFLPGAPVCFNWCFSKLSPGDQALALQMAHHPTIFIPHLSDGRDGLGKLQPGKAVSRPWHGRANGS